MWATRSRIPCASLGKRLEANEGWKESRWCFDTSTPMNEDCDGVVVSGLQCEFMTQSTVRVAPRERHGDLDLATGSQAPGAKAAYP